MVRADGYLFMTRMELESLNEPQLVSRYEYPMGKPFCDFIETIYKPQLLRPLHEISKFNGIGESRIFFRMTSLQNIYDDYVRRKKNFPTFYFSMTINKPTSVHVLFNGLFQMNDVSPAYLVIGIK